MRDALSRAFGQSFERTNRLLKLSEQLCAESRIICADSNRILATLPDIRSGRGPAGARPADPASARPETSAE